ncbi:uncharacterized protein C1orf105 homolog [Otolemur garnettii]|uniref:uncharacterized protein C1orf105 homolog n=1 Tax=Otolemur garnettii TaxID=30611 RepID=UPI000273FBAB|nr:uncharacterized protein C1orf105 homolog [Otolemur garnettii]
MAAGHFRVRNNLPRPEASRGRCCPLPASRRPCALPFPETGRLTASESKSAAERQPSVPKFEKVPWLSEASLVNKPLVLSLPKRCPQSSTSYPPLSKKDRNLPILFQVPDVLSQARRKQSHSMLLRNNWLCSTCQEITTVQPRTMKIPDTLKLSFENFMRHKLHYPRSQTVLKSSQDDISTESIHYRLPIRGPRTSVFQGLLSNAYETLQAMQPSSLPKKEPRGKSTRQ